MTRAAAATTETAVRVEVLQDEGAWFAMSEAWNGLLAESKVNTVFLTAEWLGCWWRSYGENRPLHVVKVLRDDHLIGLTAFYEKKVRKIKLTFKAMAFVGDGTWDSDYLDLIAAPGEEEAVTEAVLDYLFEVRDRWDLLLLNEIPDSSPMAPLIRRGLTARGCTQSEEQAVACAWSALPDSWDDYLKTLKPRMRTKTRSLVRKLEEAHDVQLELCEREDQLPERLASMYDLHEQRWRQVGKSGVFVFPEKRDFYERMSRELLALGWLRFHSLKVDGQYVAHQFCFDYGDTRFLLQEGMDPAWFDKGVGNVLRVYVFQDCIERGIRVYDFLGGVTQHKLSWGSDVKKSLRLTAGRKGARSFLYFDLPRAARWGRDRLRDVLGKGEGSTETGS